MRERKIDFARPLVHWCGWEREIKVVRASPRSLTHWRNLLSLLAACSTFSGTGTISTALTTLPVSDAGVMFTTEMGRSRKKSSPKSQSDSESSAAGVTVGSSRDLISMTKGNTSSSLSGEYKGGGGKVIVGTPIVSLADWWSASSSIT